MQAIDITAEQRRTILALLNRHLPDTIVWAYGSRVKWTSRPESDLDLVAFARPEQSARVTELREAFEESSLPFRVDLFVWDEVPESFRSRIESNRVVLTKDNPVREDDRGSRWRRCRIDDIAEKVAMGPFGSSIKVETFTPSGVPIISGQHLHGARVDDKPGFNFISEEHAERLRGANVRKGDIVFTHRGNIGQVSYIPDNSQYEKYIASQSQFYMRPKLSEALPEFIVAYFKTPEGQHELLANASQVGVPSIARPVTYLRSIELPIPPIEEQRAIAHILGTLDDKIELNRRMNETLETMARALFKSWFVDFDPVRAKMEGRDTGLPQPIADLFPDRMVDSELGRIPEGWAIEILGDLIELIYGKALNAGQRRSGNVPVYGSNGQIGWHDKRLVQGPGVVVGRKGNPGTVTWVASDFFPIDTTFHVVPKSGDDTLLFLFHALKHQNLASVAADSAVPGLNRNLAYMNKQVLPGSNIIECFNRHATLLFVRNDTLQTESRELAELRDSLLPELVTGKLRVGNFNAFREDI